MDLTNPYESPVGEEPGTLPQPLPPDAALVAEVVLPPDAIAIEFHAIRADYERFMEYWNARYGVPWYFKLRTYGLLLVVMGVLILVFWQLDNWDIAGPLIGSTVTFVAMVIALWQLAAWGHQRHPGGVNFEQRDAALVFWQRITLVPDYFIFSSGVEQSLIRWRRFAEVQRTDHAIYLIEHQQLTHFIPRRAFASEDQFLRFLEVATKYQQQANPIADQDIARLPGHTPT